MSFRKIALTAVPSIRIAARITLFCRIASRDRDFLHSLRSNSAVVQVDSLAHAILVQVCYLGD